ncbi:unnamed protein product [Urochloa humidicola]
MFRFSVFSKNVGLMIYKLKSFACRSFAIFFSLWGNGGPNWQKEYRLWLLEQEAEWTHVTRNKKKSFADVVRSSQPSGHRLPVFQRLKFPSDYHKNFFPSRTSVFSRIHIPDDYFDPPPSSPSPATSATRLHDQFWKVPQFLAENPPRYQIPEFTGFVSGASRLVIPSLVPKLPALQDLLQLWTHIFSVSGQISQGENFPPRCAASPAQSREPFL